MTVNGEITDRVYRAWGTRARGWRHGAGMTRIRWGETTDERDGILCADLHGMSGRKCMLTGKKANNGRSISFSHIRTKTLQQVNLQVRRAADDSSARGEEATLEPEGRARLERERADAARDDKRGARD